MYEYLICQFTTKDLRQPRPHAPKAGRWHFIHVPMRVSGTLLLQSLPVLCQDTNQERTNRAELKETASHSAVGWIASGKNLPAQPDTHTSCSCHRIDAFLNIIKTMFDFHMFEFIRHSFSLRILCMKFCCFYINIILY